MPGFVLKLTGGAVYYKTHYQPTIALSSTETDFAAATETEKPILYVRTILQEPDISYIAIIMALSTWPTTSKPQNELVILHSNISSFRSGLSGI